MHPATDLGYLLHKHPDRVQSFDVLAGQARVFYPRADEEQCTAALMLEIDPIELGRQARRKDGPFALGRYVNDRPYVASSLLAVALGKVFRTALNGRCDARPELATQDIPLHLHLPAVPDGGSPGLVARLFEPLGWDVNATPLPTGIPGWGDSSVVDLHLRGTFRLADALNQLYVLLPVLDNAKHYWVAEEEVDKLFRAGGAWLATHPERELISRRYLAHARPLVSAALERLSDPEDPVPEEETPRPLAAQRRRVVREQLLASGARSVIDLGCGGGRLLRDLLNHPEFTKITGADVSAEALAQATRALGQLPERTQQRVKLLQSALTYTDARLAGYDAGVLMEVIEHLDPERLPALERTVFGEACPRTLIVTTPNSEYNVRYPHLPAGQFRHHDHRFEWDRAEFAAWAVHVGTTFGYDVRHTGAGEADPELGHPTQIAVFTRKDNA